MMSRWTRPFRICLAVAVGGICYLAFTPLQHAVIVKVWDKGNHFIAFFVLALLLDGALPAFGSKLLLKTSILLGYGVLIECIQAFIPNRQFSGYDVLADLVGVLVYVVLIMVIGKVRPPRQTASE